MRIIVYVVLLVSCVACAAGNRQSSRVTTHHETSPPPVRGFNEYKEPGVVVVALASDQDEIVRIQLDIVTKMLASGPVAISLHESSDLSTIEAYCKEYGEVCTALQTGELRTLVDEHDGPWIRDYGPQFVRIADAVQAIDSRYSDSRLLKQARRKRRNIDLRRLHLLEERGRSSMTGIIDEQLRVLEQLKDIYADSTILEREGDDASPFYLVQSMARTGAVRVVPSSTTVDGGNLIRLPDGVCLTTSDLIPANGEGGDLDSVLGSTYGCKDVVYLRPLPGDSIKHVDMFLLPADDGHLLLASYDPRKESVGQFWHDAVPEVRRLTMEASYAMNANARLLAKRGYSVRRVVAPLPRSEPGSGFYFPTNLNALVRVSPEGQRVHVLVPTYENYEDSLQREAVRTIEKSFPGAKISTVEATAAARLQGAVHCLSLVFPYKTTVFADASSRADWKALNQLEVKAAERERRKSLLAPLLDRGVDRRGAPAETLQDGVWTNEDDVMIKFFPDGQALVFLGEGVMQISYSLNDDGSKLELVRGEDQHQEFSVEWPEADKLVLTDVDEDVSMALTRVRD